MKRTILATTTLTASLLFTGAAFAQQGTQSPDVTKQRQSAPSTSGQNPDQNSSDVPKQEPGTNNPDVGKQRGTDKSGPANATPPNTNQGSKAVKGKKKNH